MIDRLLFQLNRLNEKLWVRPLFFILVSILAVFIAKLADRFEISSLIPKIEPESLTDLLTILSSSMLMISTFAVGSMVSAFAAASTTATPRSVSLVIADDVSQNALSLFIGAFIFSLVSLFALKNSYFQEAGYFALFLMTVCVLTLVILTFLRWVDKIARLGRMGTTIAKVEDATRRAFIRRRDNPYLNAVPISADDVSGYPVYTDKIGYVQRIELQCAQNFAKQQDLTVTICALPGKFVAPGRPIAYVDKLPEHLDMNDVEKAFLIDDSRLFDEDPRFGVIVLSEIACRALSPAVNDPGTSIVILGRLVSLFHEYVQPTDTTPKKFQFDRVKVPALKMGDLFDDAFTPMIRDGAGTIEVMIRMQKTFFSLANMGNADMAETARHFAIRARERATKAIDCDYDLAELNTVSSWIEEWQPNVI